MSFIDEVRYTLIKPNENKRVWTVFAINCIQRTKDSVNLSNTISKGLKESGYMRAENTSTKKGYREHFCHVDKAMPKIILEHEESFEVFKFKCFIGDKIYRIEDIPMLFDYIRLAWINKNSWFFHLSFIV